MRIVFINQGVAWQIFEADTIPENGLTYKDISDSKYREVQEGWIYEKETEAFIEPSEPIPVPIAAEPSAEELMSAVLLEIKYQTALTELMS